MNKISFEEAGSLLVTFHAEEGVEAGQAVKVSKNGTVGPCQAGDLFCGIAVTCRNGAAGVQVQGFVQVPVTLPVALGWTRLVADGKGGVMVPVEESGSDGQQELEEQAATAAELAQGVSALVVDVDTVGKTAVICL